MSVYMETLNDDLVHAWEEGVWTYDRATKTNFKMYVLYQYSLHDYPTYGIFCSWCVHGKFPCPVCKVCLMFIWLTKGGKYSSFDKHRQFLPLDHPFRRDINNFTKDIVVEGPAPQMMIGAMKIHSTKRDTWQKSVLSGTKMASLLSVCAMTLGIEANISTFWASLCRVSQS